MDGALSSEDRDDARKIFEGEVEGVTGCHHCAGIHARVANLPAERQPCPRIKTATWHPDGTMISVEYFRPGWWESQVIFPHDVYNDEDDDE